MSALELFLLTDPITKCFTENKLFKHFDFFADRHFVLDKELNDIHSIIKGKRTNLKLWIQGDAGCGKTTLSRKLASNLQQSNKTVLYINEYYFDSIFYRNSDSFLKSLEQLKKESVNYDFLIIDGLDEFYQLDILFHFKTKKTNTIVFSRNNPNDTSYFLYRIDDLSFDRIKIFLSKLKEETSANFDFSTKYSVRKIINEVYKNSHSSYEENFGETQQYILGKGISTDTDKIVLPSNDSILPPQKIITDLSIINNSLLDQIKDNPTQIYNLTSREFEELICELFQKQGYDVTLTKKTKDGGKDLIILSDCFLGGFLIYVECKKHSPNRPVGVNLVRELYGTVSADKATAGILISTSYFSREAISFQQSIQHQMKLIDYRELIKIITETAQF